jgi:hypothetical protein
MKHPVPPEQVQSLRRGEEIAVLVPLKWQPPSDRKWGRWSLSDDGELMLWSGHGKDSELWLSQCPFSIGDPVELECATCHGSGLCGVCKGENLLFLGNRIRSIFHREVDGVHHWVLRCGGRSEKGVPE